MFYSSKAAKICHFLAKVGKVIAFSSLRFVVFLSIVKNRKNANRLKRLILIIADIRNNFC